MNRHNGGSRSVHPAAPTSRDIKVVTAVVLVVNAGLFVTAFLKAWMAAPAALLAITVLVCYLRTPVGYEVSPAGLTVIFRLGSKSFGPVTRAASVESGIGRSIRLWGNGGLFAGTGLFWNRAWGTFRAYVTTSDRSHLVLLTTPSWKVLVSPNESAEFIAGAMGREA